MSVFFTSRKTGFKSWLDTSLIPCCLSSFFSFFSSHSQQLLDTWWIDRESSCPLDSFSIAGGQIELLFLHLMDCSSTPPRYLYLLTTISLIPASIASSISLDTCIYWDLLRTYIFILRDPILIFFDLSWFVRTCSSPKHYLSHSKPLPLWFFKLFQDFLLLVSF